MKKLAFLLVSVVFGASPYAATPTASPSPAFDVMEYVVEGNTVLPDAVVERALEPYLGPDKTFKDIEAARAALEKAYQDSGFLSVVVSLPNQRVDAGEVKLAVTEAVVEKLTVSGSTYHRPSVLGSKVPSLAKGAIPYFPQVQQELADAQNKDVQITPLIGGGDDPSKVQVDLKVQDSVPLRGSIEANSRQSHNTKAGRTELALGYGNLFQSEHFIGLSWQYAPTRPSDANTLSLLYMLPMGNDDSLVLSYTRSSSDTPTNTSLGGATLTRGQFAGMLWRHDLDARQWPVNHSLSWAIDYKNNKDRNRDIGGISTASPPLRYPVFSVHYDLRWNGDHDTVTNWRTGLITSSGQFAARDIDCKGTVRDQFACKRSSASPDFLVWKLGMDREQYVWGQWQVRFSADLQMASGPLVPGEQYSLGGVDSVRGYYDYEQSGDEGANVRLELVTPTWSGLGKDARVKALAFWDRGVVHTKNALATELSQVNLGSYGLGLRAENGSGFKADFNLAVPVYETVKANEAGTYLPTTGRKADRSVRVDLSVRQAF